MEQRASAEGSNSIRTPDQRLRVFVSSTLEELRPERDAVREAVDGLRLTSVMFERGARPHAPRDLYRAYLAQSDVFVGVYWQRYGWVATGEPVSGLEDEYLRAAALPELVYVKTPAPDREPLLSRLLERVRGDDVTSYKKFDSPAQLQRLVQDDLAVLLSERFAAADEREPGPSPPPALPAAMTPLIGRDAEAAGVVHLLGAGAARLVTLTGPGGVGKSRLAVEVAARVAPSLVDHVALVELASVVDADDVAAAVAVTLGVRRRAGTLLEDLVDHLADREMLLVVDNFEHVVDAAPVLSALLAAAAGLRVLVTSRRPLRLTGEQVYEVPPLSLPTVAGSAGLLDAASSDAVCLFVQRAQAADAGFVLNEDNVAAVAAVVRGLDGLPLALELAAARVKMLPPAVLLARLDERLTLLTGGPRDLAPRQQTLKRAIAWSHDLLDVPARVLFAQLGTFEGGFDLAAVQAVSGRRDPLDTLAELVEASLITAETSDGEPRFFLLVTIRDFAREQLHDGEAWRLAHDRHAVHFRELAESADAELHGSGQVIWLDRLERDVGNLRAAVIWLLDHDRIEDAIRLVFATWLFWWLRGHVDEARRWTVRMVAASAALSPQWQSLGLTVAGAMAFASGDLVNAERFLQQAVDLFGAADNIGGSELPMILLGQTLSMRGEYERATKLLDDGLVLSRRQGNHWESAKQLNFRGQIPLSQGDPAAAASWFEQALHESRAVGDRLLILTSLSNLALCQQVLGKGVAAHALLDEGVALAAEAGDDASARHFRERLGALNGTPDVLNLAKAQQSTDAGRETSGIIWLRVFAAAPLDS